MWTALLTCCLAWPGGGRLLHESGTASNPANQNIDRLREATRQERLRALARLMEMHRPSPARGLPGFSRLPLLYGEAVARALWKQRKK
jgi:hypothetical protein